MSSMRRSPAKDNANSYLLTLRICSWIALIHPLEPLPNSMATTSETLSRQHQSLSVEHSSGSVYIDRSTSLAISEAIFHKLPQPTCESVNSYSFTDSHSSLFEF